MEAGTEKTLQVFTIGHSNLSFEQFLPLLKEFAICIVADIRRYPSSRKFPHFNRQVLCKQLAAENIEYLWLEALGGRRQSGKNDKSAIRVTDKSLNIGLKSPGFRNYADHMATDEFSLAVQELLSAAARARTAVMCAEKLYWKCHRRLLSDYLAAHGVEVVHIIGPGKASNHKLTPGAIITAEGWVIYPSQEPWGAQNNLFES